MPAELPSGTVTLLFTDIEGSTRMLQELGREAYVRSLTAHRRLLREAFTAHNGVEVEMQGDSFHFAFPFARDAVAAAAAGQSALTEHDWESEPIRVRIGLHTGEPMQADGLYAGIDVHRAARVMSAGRGGQVVLSERTADLVTGELPEGLQLRDLGQQLLKDFAKEQRLFELVPDGLPSESARPRRVRVVSHRWFGIAAALSGLGIVSAILAAVLLFGKDPKPAAEARVASTTRVTAPAPLTVTDPAAVTPPPVGATLERVAANSVGFIHPDGRRIVGEVTVGPEPSRIVFTEKAVWVALGNSTVMRIDPRVRTVVAAVPIQERIHDLAAGGDDVWVLAGNAGTAPQLARVDADFNAVYTKSRVDVALSSFGGNFARPAMAVAADNVWVTDPYPPGLLRWLDPGTAKVRGRLVLGRAHVGAGPAITIADSSLWVTVGTGTVTRIDLRRKEVIATIPISVPQARGFSAGGSESGGPVQLTSGAGAIWLVTQAASQCCPSKTIGTATLQRIDRVTDTVTGVIAIEGRPVGVAAGTGGVWVANRAGKLFRVNPRTMALERTLDLGAPIGGVAVGGGLVWVTVQG